MVDYQTIFQFLQTIGILVGVFYYIMTIRTNKRNQDISLRNQELTLKAQDFTLETRQAQLFMNIYNKFASKEFQKDSEQMMVVWEWNDYDDFMAKYGPEANPDDHAIWDMSLQFYEGIGVIVRRGLIDPELVYDLMYGSIIGFWERHEVIIQGIRDRARIPQVWDDIEYIYNVMKSIQNKRHSLET